MAVKSPEAFRTISEVARELDVPQHVLRFWETRFSQVRPMKRGGGRRYYRPEDIALLRGIHKLLYGDGFTIRGVQKILRERGVQHVVAALAPGTPAAPAPPTREEGNVVQLDRRRAGNGGAGAAGADDGPDAGALRDGVRAALDELGSLKTILDRARE